MQILREWALTVALAALAGGIVWLIAPKGSIQKALKTVISVFLLLIFLSPFVKKWNFNEILPENDSIFDAKNYQNIANKQLQTLAEEEIRKKIYQIMANEFELDGKVLFETSISSDGSIEISQVLIQIAPTQKLEALRERLRERLGIECSFEIIKSE